MITLRLHILEEHALDIIRSLEKLRAVEVVIEETMPPTAPTQKWGGIIKNPSEELLSYANKVREEWEDRI
ncbi:hypothetical protein QWY85_01200 [Neolewinella lacunae]|uniref:Uncharacterized protein n=1 Tax=Neolewinella lacunae TaxID=1517758 RepID=A0A923TDL4_9BACT|nr:hypothetical protein [Neolewinella lacunae]MBC6994977.1 hypothetical protein [Neolewinella lacunae]MDN3633252.1 hypothetical protein [Neolewinella lacunae]